MGVLDDLKDKANAGLGKIEDGIDAGKKLVGEGVDWTTNKIGDGLDYVGADGAADAVEDWGDDVASDLGATPGEQQLGETEEANELVHGNPDRIRASAKHLKDFHRAFDQVSSGMRKVDSSGWAGEGGDAFRKKFGVHPAKWAQAADACEKASGALDTYADTVKWAQGKAKDAVELYKKGKKASEDAVEAYNKRVDAYNAKIKANEDPGPRPEPFQDPGKADIEKARETLAEARKQRNTAAGDAQSKVKAALAHAPAEPPPLDRLGSNLVDGYQAYNTELTHLGGGVLKGAAGLVNFARGLNPTDPYNLTHPAAYMENVSMTLSGLASTAAHPERIVTTAIDGFKKDPSEFLGRLIPELIGTKGAGLVRSGTRLGLRGAERAAIPEGGTPARRTATKEPHTENPREKVENDPSDPVDLVTGTMYLPQTDITLPGTLPLVFTRRLESGSRLGRWFGASWTSTLDQRLEIDAEGVIFVTEDGLLLTYPHPAPGVPTLPTHGTRRWPLDRTDEGYTITDPYTGRTWHFTDQTPDRSVLEQIDDRNGNWITFEHTPDGTPLAVTASGGYRLTLTVQDDRVTTLFLAGAAPDGSDQEIKRYAYSENGDLTQVFNSSGPAITFAYDDRGRVTSWTDSNDRSYTYVYDDRDRCIAEGGEAGHMALRLTYDEKNPVTGHRVTTATTGEGHTRRYLIDAADQVIAETDPLGHVTRFTRDRFGRVLTRTDALGRVTTCGYDEEGNMVSVTCPDGREVSAEYGDFNRLTRIRGADGNTTRHTYDACGNRLTSTTPTSDTTHFTHDEAGRLTSVRDPLGHTTTVHCDQRGLPIEITDPLGAVTCYERDPFGRPVTMTDPTGLTTHLEWTVEGQLARRIAPDGTSEAWSYDGEGNCTTHTDPLGGTTHFEYTHFDLLTARTAPDGTRHEFAHDAELRLIRVTNPQGLTWDYGYDAAGRLISETDFDDRTLTYVFDPGSHLVSRTNALDETTTFERDVLGRTIRKDAAGRVSTFAYDLSDQLAEAVSPDGIRLTILRDQYGRVRTETVDGRTLTYDHDELGRRTGRTTPTGARTTWSHDAAGRRTNLIVSGRTIDSTYDDAGRELTCGIGNFLTLANTYDPMGRLATQTATTDGEILQHRGYTYRADGNLAALDDHLDGPHTFTLDPVGRVTAVQATNWTESYAYDAAGNQTTADWPTTHPGHEATGDRTYTGTRITRAGTVRYEHDALGRVSLRQKPRLSRKPDTWHYQWDPEDRLTQVTTPDGTVWRYTYDPLGRRTSKQRMSADGISVTERITFTWDGTTLCEQTTSTPGIPNQVTLTWEHRGLRPIAQTERIAAADAPQVEIDSRFFAIITDLVGTPRELIDEQGDIAWRTRTTLWGRTTWNTTARAYTPLRFPGQYYDPETGLHYNYFRHYDPDNARYLTSDPLGLSPAPNPATYVHNPHTWGDPLGLAPDAGCPDAPSHKTASSRNEAFRMAKRDLDIPMSQQPDSISRVPMTDRTGQQIMDESHNPVMTREYTFTRNDGSQVIIQDHGYGHYYGEGGVGDQGSHFNVRPSENPRTGKVPGTAQHYEY
ncbi:putative T7SS-secreted protein [Streptomyces rubiginosohelvolus]|uniref:putative T7SS-secreted protein n=1 Tax=Streptomyces TaxID=1883 RepID=UPI000F86F075|nr:HNH/endonuclease VII fold putative polymorphic toxin [Streptomyces sp. NP10]RUP68526.1 putative deoxyribonuclease RhsC [Streptomyces sp. NP10]